MDDLRAYRPVMVEPLRLDLLGRTFLAFPPPSSGGVTLLGIVAALEARRDLWQDAGFASDDYLHALAEAMKLAFADRASYLGDPEFADVPIGMLLDAGRARARAGMVRSRGVVPQARAAAPWPIPEDGGTSHVSVVDRWGNAVACTETINLRFGSLVAVAEYGFCLNNEMDDFLTRRGVANAYGLEQDERNLPEPGKRPLSSMSPTIVLDGAGRVEAVAGASGGPRIISGTVQVLLNALLGGDSARDAIARRRVHHQWAPHAVYVESVDLPEGAGRLDAIGAALADRGHEVRERREVGVVQVIVRDDERGGWHAASDPRKGGAPSGL